MQHKHLNKMNRFFPKCWFQWEKCQLHRAVPKLAQKENLDGSHCNRFNGLLNHMIIFLPCCRILAGQFWLAFNPNAFHYYSIVKQAILLPRVSLWNITSVNKQAHNIPLTIISKHNLSSEVSSSVNYAPLHGKMLWFYRTLTNSLTFLCVCMEYKCLGL